MSKKSFVKKLMPFVTLMADLISLFFRLIPKNRKLVIFGSMAGNYYGDNSRYVFERILQTNPELQSVWMTRKKSIYNELIKMNLPVCYMYSVSGLTSIIRASLGVYTNNLADIALFPTLAPSNMKLLALRHGRSVKKVRYAANTNRLSFSERFMIKKETKMIHGAISTSEFISEVQELVLRIGADKHFITGYPRNDALYNDIKDHFLKTLRDQYNNIILYGPTWRHGDNPVKFFPFSNVSIADLNEILKSKNSLLLLRPHKNELKHKEVRSQLEECESHSNIKTITHEDLPSVNDLLPLCNGLICDYSALYHDFLLLDRPLIMVPYDFELLEKKGGFLYDYYDRSPGPIVSDYSQFFDEILNILNGDDTYKLQRRSLCNLIHKYNDNHSTDRVIKLLLKFL